MKRQYGTQVDITSPEPARYKSAVTELLKRPTGSLRTSEDRKMAAGSSQASVSSLLNEAIRFLSDQQPEQPVSNTVQPSRSERVAENLKLN